MNQQTLLSIIRHTLIIVLICYIPHFINAPWWLLLVILSTIGYRLIADYYGHPLLNLWLRILLVIACLVLLKINYGSMMSSGFFIGSLLIFVALKIIEVHKIRDVKVLILCNMYLILSALIMVQEIWILIYLPIALIANFSLMLKVNAPEASITQIGKSNFKHLIIALPLSIILFYIFPRIADPLWKVPAVNASGKIGFNDRMEFGVFGDLAADDSTALRVSFKNNQPIVNGYWRGLVLNFYDGFAWQFLGNNYDAISLQQLGNRSADFEVMLEPHQKKWLFYMKSPIAAKPNLQFSPNAGLTQANNRDINQRFFYAMTVQNTPYRPLTNTELNTNLQYPKNLNPQLKQWADQQYSAVHRSPDAFIIFLQNYINQQPFWYTLTPPLISNNQNQMDKFWFDTQKGYCEHYASAITLMLRMNGIPARVVVGYQGGVWNPLAQYLDIQQNRAHAWVEYWQENKGWKEFDPTVFIARARIDQAIKDRFNNLVSQQEYDASWYQKTQILIDSAQFFVERWLLFYNQDAQHHLFEKTGIGDWQWPQVIKAIFGCFMVFIVCMAVYYHWLARRKRDPLLHEYHLLQQELKRFNVPVNPMMTLEKQSVILKNKTPKLAEIINNFINKYEVLRLMESAPYSKDNIKHTLGLFRELRKVLKDYRKHSK